MKPLTLTILLIALLAPLQLFATPDSTARSAKKPNIVFVLADDLGWRDVGFHGAKFAESPNLDALAHDGMIMNQFYSGGPNCAPTRACIMTGMYSPRTQLYTPGGKSKGSVNLMRLLVPARGGDAEHNTLESRNNTIEGAHTCIAEVLKSAGYTTARIGKWHLGPDTQGFDLSTCNGNNGTGKKHYGSITVARSMTDRAVKFIDENKDKPFFLYVAHWDVHGPHRALKEEVNKYKKKSQGWDNATNEKPNPVYAAMITAVDESVGRIRGKLKETGLDKNTIFIFSSDNGGTPVTTMEPLRGAKGALFEGGIRVSTCVTWPGVIKPGSSCDTPLTSVDLLPTFAEIAGAQLPKNQPVDGRSFLPLLKGKKALDERAIFWHYPLYLTGNGAGKVKPVHGTTEPYWRGVPATVMRKGDWKIFYFYEDKSVELYDVKNDISEKKNLATEQAKRTATMKKELLTWVKNTKAPTPDKLNPKFGRTSETAPIGKGQKAP